MIGLGFEWTVVQDVTHRLDKLRPILGHSGGYLWGSCWIVGGVKIQITKRCFSGPFFWTNRGIFNIMWSAHLTCDHYLGRLEWQIEVNGG
jgi:hypothetical protein